MPEKEFGSAVVDRLMQDALITEALVLDDRDVAIDRFDGGWNLMPIAGL